MTKYSREELIELQEKIKEYNQEDIKKLSSDELKKLQYLQCPFCQIIDGLIPSKKIYEDDKCTAILDINPATPGHIILLPKEHYQVGPQITTDLMKHLGNITKKLSNACLIGLKCEGTTISISNGPAAGQKSPHFMINIIPRYNEDGIKFKCDYKNTDNNELASLSNNLKEYICKKLNLKCKDEKKIEKPIKEKGYLYFVDSDGDISRVKIKKRNEPKNPKEKVMKIGLKREPNLLYYVNANLEIESKPMNRKGRPKSINKTTKKIKNQLINNSNKNKSKKANLDYISNLFK